MLLESSSSAYALAAETMDKVELQRHSDKRWWHKGRKEVWGLNELKSSEFSKSRGMKQTRVNIWKIKNLNWALEGVTLLSRPS